MSFYSEFKQSACNIIFGAVIEMIFKDGNQDTKQPNIEGSMLHNSTPR